MRTRTTSLLSTVLTASLAACSPFRGYIERPPEGSAVTIGDCYTAYIYQPRHEERAHLIAAFSEVCSIFHDETFRRRVFADSQWIGRVDKLRAHTVRGDEVVKTVLDARFTSVHLFSRRNHFSIATTRMHPDGISIDPPQIAKWASNELKERAELLNTVAHELSHLARECPPGGSPTDTRCEMRFLDEGHDDCSERRLVSYHLGDMVECHVQFSNDADFAECLKERRSKCD